MAAQFRPRPVRRFGDAGTDRGTATDAAAAALQRRNEGMDRRALANLKPFVVALFEGPANDDDDDDADAGSGGGDGTEPAFGGFYRGSAPPTAVLVGFAAVPPGSYAAALACETAKPQRLNTIVSTDRAPLTTRTAPVTFSQFAVPADFKMALRRVRPSSFGPSGGADGGALGPASGFAGLAMGLAPEVAAVRGELEGGRRAMRALAATPHRGEGAAERAAIVRAHKEMLMDAITDAKLTRAPWMRRP